jgi:hypothetical protein
VISIKTVEAVVSFITEIYQRRGLPANDRNQRNSSQKIFTEAGDENKALNGRVCTQPRTLRPIRVHSCQFGFPALDDFVLASRILRSSGA